MEKQPQEINYWQTFDVTALSAGSRLTFTIATISPITSATANEYAQDKAAFLAGLCGESWDPLNATFLIYARP